MTAASRPSLADTMRASRPRATGETPRPVSEVMSEGSPGSLDKRITIYLNEATWRAMRHSAVEEDTNISQIIESLCQDYLNRRN